MKSGGLNVLYAPTREGEGREKQPHVALHEWTVVEGLTAGG